MERRSWATGRSFRWTTVRGLPHRSRKERTQLVMVTPSRTDGLIPSTRVLVVLLTLLVGSASPSLAAGGIEWIQGFPQRMGDQVILMWMPAPGAARYAVSRRDTTTGVAVSWDSATTYSMDATSDPRV